MFLNEKCFTFSPDAADEALAAVRAATSCGETVVVTSGVAMLSPAQAAAQLGISRAVVQRRIVSGEIAATRVGSRYQISPNEIDRFRRAHMNPPGARTAPPAHPYAAVYERVLFPFLEGDRDRYFDEREVSGTFSDRAALDLLYRAGAVIRWGGRLSIGESHKALMLFATTELLRTDRVRWSPAELSSELIAAGELIPGSGSAVLRHFKLDINPVGSLPEAVWHGTGPAEFSPTEKIGWIPWVPDGLRGVVPIAVAYADLYCVSDWRANEFADYTLRRIMPREG